MQMSAEAAAARVILGTMTFGQQVAENVAADMLELYLGRGGRDIDTAHIYSQGRSEQILGRLLSGRPRESFEIATKAHPSVKGNLGAGAVREQLELSLERLQLDAVDLFYLHQPDLDTPVEETLGACAELHRRGLFRELGLSNYASWQVADMVHICRREGWPVPAVYQGMYNAITREVERELFPCLRAMKMRFYAYNPLAAGVLTGRYSWKAESPGEGRFREYGFYVDRYWKRSYIESAEGVGVACEAAGVNMAAAALVWLCRHSRVEGAAGDGVIVGASRMEHAAANLEACAAGPLPESVVGAFDAAWEQARPDCPKYLRP
jgi:aflatoxin B1 aldehyde reductase